MYGKPPGWLRRYSYSGSPDSGRKLIALVSRYLPVPMYCTSIGTRRASVGSTTTPLPAGTVVTANRGTFPPDVVTLVNPNNLFFGLAGSAIQSFLAVSVALGISTRAGV